MAKVLVTMTEMCEFRLRSELAEDAESQEERQEILTKWTVAELLEAECNVEGAHFEVVND